MGLPVPLWTWRIPAPAGLLVPDQHFQQWLAVLILLWVSTWFCDHELLGWVLIIGGYVIDFGPCIYRLLVSRRR